MLLFLLLEISPQQKIVLQCLHAFVERPGSLCNVVQDLFQLQRHFFTLQDGMHCSLSIFDFIPYVVYQAIQTLNQCVGVRACSIYAFNGMPEVAGHCRIMQQQTRHAFSLFQLFHYSLQADGDVIQVPRCPFYIIE